MEFHAIVLCGPGHNLVPFCGSTPKSLLPVANTAMVHTVLDWCHRAFFSKVTLVCSQDSSHEIDASLAVYKQTHDLAVDVLSVESEFSGAVLYHLYKHWTSSQEHFVLLPCDFITNLPPQVLIEAYRNKHDSDIGVAVHYRNQLDIEDKKRNIFPRAYTLYDSSDSQLLDAYSQEDVDFHRVLQVRTQMVWRHPRATVSTKLLNSSIFFGSTRVFKVFDAMPDKFTEQYFACRPISKVVRDLARRSWKHSKPLDTIGLLVIPHQATFFRINNTPVLMEANRLEMQAQAAAKAQAGAPQQRDKTVANVGIDSLIGEGTTLGERTNVKKTVVGSNCTIGKRVKLTGNLIMNNVTIEDDVQLENCIIGSGATIRAKSRLTNCNVEDTHEVRAGSQFKGETLLNLSLEGFVEDAVESSSEFESDEDSDEESEFDDKEHGDNSDGLFDY